MVRQIAVVQAVQAQPIKVLQVVIVQVIKGIVQRVQIWGQMQILEQM